MKMKKYLLLFVAALALGFASCSDDETIPNRRVSPSKVKAE